MPSRNLWLFFAICLAVAAMHLNWAYSQLPEQMATHFNASGEPDGWSSRSGFAVAYLLLIGTSALVFAGLALLMHRLPMGTVSLPNRDFWLAPERRAVTVRRLAEYLLVIGGVTTLFNVGVMHLTVQANRGLEVHLSGWFWLLFTVYMVFVLGWVAWLLWSFRVPRR